MATDEIPGLRDVRGGARPRFPRHTNEGTIRFVGVDLDQRGFGPGRRGDTAGLPSHERAVERGARRREARHGQDGPRAPCGSVVGRGTHRATVPPP